MNMAQQVAYRMHIVEHQSMYTSIVNGLTPNTKSLQICFNPYVSLRRSIPIYIEDNLISICQDFAIIGI